MCNLSEQQDFIEKFGFALMVSNDLQMTHVPLTLVKDEGKFGTLYGHIAKANPQWKVLDNTVVKAVFNGPHSYISPNWYASGPGVPTWNYVAVHVTGKAKILDDVQTFEAVKALVNQYEPALLQNEMLMPADYQQKLAKAIIGFKIEIKQLEGVNKLGQHKSVADQQGTMKGLSKSTHSDASILLTYMRQTGLGVG